MTGSKKKSIEEPSENISNYSSKKGNKVVVDMVPSGLEGNPGVEENQEPSEAENSLSASSTDILLGRAWEDGPTVDLNHVTTVSKEFKRREKAVKFIRLRPTANRKFFRRFPAMAKHGKLLDKFQSPPRSLCPQAVFL